MNFDIRTTNINDAKLLFDWANDPITRENSFSSEFILWEDHLNWFTNRLNNNSTLDLLFSQNNIPIGLVRFDMGAETIISITISPNHRGKGFGPILLKQGCENYWKSNNKDIIAYIKRENESSLRAFTKAGFKIFKHTHFKGVECICLNLTHENNDTAKR